METILSVLVWAVAIGWIIIGCKDIMRSHRETNNYLEQIEKQSQRYRKYRIDMLKRVMENLKN